MPPKKQEDEKDVEGSASGSSARIPTPPLVQLTSPWLTSLTSRIRSRPIPWEGYARADLVSQDELKMIRSVDVGKDDNGAADKVLDERGQEYAMLYLRLLTKLSRTDTLQQVLVLVGDMLQGRDDRLHLFFEAATKLQSGDAMLDKSGDEGRDHWPWAPLVRLLRVSDDFAQLKAAQIITLLLVAPQTSHSSTLTRNASKDVLARLLAFLAALINTGTSEKTEQGGDTDGDGRAPSSSTSPGSGALQTNPSPDAYADGNGADIAIQLLEALLRTQQFRKFVWQDEMKRMGDGANARPGVIRGLVYILQNALVAPRGKRGDEGERGERGEDNQQQQASSSSSSSPSSSSPSPTSASATTSSRPVSFQTQYQVIFCLWLLSFDSSIAAQLHRKFNIIPLIVDVARSAVKEKVIRVCVAMLRNLLGVTDGDDGSSSSADANAVVMLGCKALPLMENFKERKWSDDDIGEDLEFIAERLQERLKGMSTLDSYLSELASGTLTWDNPAHDLDDFWRANASKLLDEQQSKAAVPDSQNDEEEGGGADDGGDAAASGDESPSASSPRRRPRTALTRLLHLLSTSQDETTLAVALHDIGKIISFTDTARKHINEERGGSAKITVMQLMSHGDAEVKYRALSTVGKLMSASWRGA